MRPALKTLIHRLATLSALCVMVIGMGGASCLSIIFDPEDGGTFAQDAGTDFDDTTCGDGAICTPGCSSDDIESDGVEVCASCESGDDGFQVCGDVVTMPCFTVESPFGGACQQCVSEDGEFSFNTCEDGQDQIVEVVCREVDVEFDGEDGAASVETCEICTDETGRVVSRTCRPDSDSCENVVENGLECEVCTLDGEFAYRECVPVQIEPRVCETYGDDDARCLDCYGADDELLLHICASGGEVDQGEIECDGYVNVDGEFCERCFNTQTGEIIEEFCDEGPNPSERCERLFFENAECTVCVIDGELLSSECEGICREDNEPEDPNGVVRPECPAQCGLSSIDDDVVCIECFDEFTGDIEQQCTSGGPTDLLCEVIFETVDPNDPGAGPGDDPESPEAAPPPPPCNSDSDCDDNEYCNDDICLSIDEEPPLLTDLECLVCLDPDTREEVYRDCEPVGEPVQPECYVEQRADGSPCEICFDPITGETFFDSCSEEPPPPPPEQCFEFETYLFGEDGDILLFEDNANPDGQQEVVASCQQCEGEGFDDGYEECNLFSYCDQFECEDANLVTVRFDPPVCNAPWGDLFAGNSEELGRVLGWALNDVQVEALEVVRLGRIDHSTCGDNDGCDCERGDTISLLVTENSAQELAAFGFDRDDGTDVEPMP